MIFQYQAPRPDIDHFIGFAEERERIRLRRAAGEPWPWTGDAILRTYRFTNIRRRDDRVSQWILKNVMPMRLTLPRPDFRMFSALSRWINWPPTIAAVIDHHTGYLQFDWKKAGQVIDSLPGKRWTSAYMIHADTKKSGRPKGAFVSEDVIGASADRFRNLDFSKNTRYSVWKQLREFPYFGDFMAGQVVDDWTWTPLLDKATDHYTWAPQGPGSIRGLNRLLGLPLKSKPGQADWASHSKWLVYLQDWRTQLVNALGPKYEDLTLMDVQNILCEWDKYERVRLSEGRPRAKYVSHNY